MAPAYSESDTHDFVKSCVSFSVIDMSIHKLPDLRSVLRTGTGKNVYEKQRTDDPYTTGLCSVRSKPTAFAQRASHLLRSKPAAFAQWAPHLLHSKPIALTKRVCLSAPGAPALSPGPSHSPGGSIYRRSCADGDQCFRLYGNAVRSEGSITERRAARPAGRHRELKGERTGMYRRCTEDV